MASNTPAEHAAVPETPLWKQPTVLKGALLTLRLLQVSKKPTTASLDPALKQLTVQHLCDMCTRLVRGMRVHIAECKGSQPSSPRHLHLQQQHLCTPPSSRQTGVP
jgi:hypothetical protein